MIEKGEIYFMPYGVIVDSVSVLLGGLIGVPLSRHISENFISMLNLILGACSMAMGITAIIQMQNMPAVTLSIIIGSCVGLLIHLGKRIKAGAKKMSDFVSHDKLGDCEQDKARGDDIVTAMVLFCASGTGVYGSLIAGMLGDHSILLAKAVLDFATAIVFACALGRVVSFIAVPQFVIFCVLFFFAKAIYPLTTPEMIGDFKACGGVIMLCTGFCMTKSKAFPIADMLPAMIIIMPISIFWSNVLLPFVSMW